MSITTTTLVWSLILFLCAAAQELTVTTSLGPVRGVTTTLLGADLSIFYGIPYAKPPVGDLRFERPVPIPPWTEPRDAFVKPNTCHCAVDEAFNKFDGVNMWNPNTPLSEDCLYLNVWAPTKGSPKKAILVWIYGGTFSFGTSTLRLYDGKYLAAANDVIVVSMNYRSGPLGFMSYGEDLEGNMGFLDVIMALQWVKDNAVNFRGDVDRITVFGESSGAVMAGMLMLSPLSRNLFNNVILQSSSPLCYWGMHSQATAKRRTEKLAKIFSCPTDNVAEMLKCFRTKDPQDLSEKAWNVVDYYLDAPFVPVVDKYALMDTPENLLARGDVKNASVLAGCMKDEGNYFLLYGFLGSYYNLTDNKPLTEDQYRKVIVSLAAPSNAKTQTAIDIEYRRAILHKDRDTYRDIADDISGDRAFKCPTIDFASEMSTINSAVYLYSNEHRISTNPWPEWMGVLHGYEIEVVFGLPLDDSYNYTTDEVTFSRQMMEMWTNFAKTNDPNTQGGTGDAWPKYDKTSQRYVKLNTPYIKKAEQGLRHDKCTFWREMVPLLTDTATSTTTPPTSPCVNSSNSVFPAYSILLLAIGAISLGLHFTKYSLTPNQWSHQFGSPLH